MVEEMLRGYLNEGKKISGRLNGLLPRDGELNPTTSISFFVDIWQHLSETCSNKKPLTIWVGTPDEVQKQLNEVYEKAGLDPQTIDFLKFVPNIALLEEKNPQKKQEEKPESQANVAQKSA